MAFVTEEFWPQGDFVARSVGMPDVPRVQLPHPLAGSGIESLVAAAEEAVPTVLAAWRGDA